MTVLFSGCTDNLTEEVSIQEDKIIESGCSICHTNQETLKELAVEEEPEVEDTSSSSCGGEAPPLKKYEKFYVAPSYMSSTHGKEGCIQCHGGSNQTDMSAHEGIIRDPSSNPELCARCHEEISTNYTNSLHNTLMGQMKSIEVRSHQGIFDSELKEAWDKDCYTCHATCGQCHISRPDVVKGGLLSGHQVLKTPPSKDVCIACHGKSKEGGAYMADYGTGDVHWTRKMMECTDCHGDEIHGDGNAYENRYQVTSGPACTQCHDLSQSQVMQHTIHGDDLSCYVCHSGPAMSCLGCHEGYDENNEWFRTSEEVVYTFKIGLNPSPDALHPYKFVTVRRAPTVPDIFESLGVDLPNYDTVPTWKMSTTHNIQRYTVQNSDCNSCHGVEELFLQASDLGPDDSKADQEVIVTEIPIRR